MPEATPNLQVIIDHVKAQSYYQDVYHLGVYNCRPIANSQTFSQHSWPNAVDIHVTNGTWVATPAEKAVGDAVYADLVATFGDDLYELIWWSSSHWNHLHVSAYPKGWLTPPCAGGALRIKYRDGTVANVDEFPLTIKGGNEDMAILTDNEQLALQAWLSKLDAMGSNVGYIDFLIPDMRKNIVTKDELDAAIAAVEASNVDAHARSLAQKALDKLAAIKGII